MGIPVWVFGLGEWVTCRCQGLAPKTTLATTTTPITIITVTTTANPVLPTPDMNYVWIALAVGCGLGLVVGAALRAVISGICSILRLLYSMYKIDQPQKNQPTDDRVKRWILEEFLEREC
ncbi:hypothetical protein PG988_006196 [Apiospora saccharicola]